MCCFVEEHFHFCQVRLLMLFLKSYFYSGHSYQGLLIFPEKEEEEVLVSTRTVSDSITAVGKTELCVHAQYQSLIVRGRIYVIVGNQVKVHCISIVVTIVITIYGVTVLKNS